MNQSAATSFPTAGDAAAAPVDALYNGIRNRLFLRESAAFCAAALFLAGGVVLACASIAEAALGFSPERYAIMIAVYMALDGMGTACNLTGDGAIAMLVDRFRGRASSDL